MNQGATTQDLIDLAIEYEMVNSTLDFNSRSAPVQAAILKQMRRLLSEIGG